MFICGTEMESIFIIICQWVRGGCCPDQASDVAVGRNESFVVSRHTTTKKPRGSFHYLDLLLDVVVLTQVFTSAHCTYNECSVRGMYVTGKSEGAFGVLVDCDCESALR